MTRDELISVINAVRPGAEWVLRSETYDGLEWHDAAQTKPTAKELGF